MAFRLQGPSQLLSRGSRLASGLKACTLLGSPLVIPGPGAPKPEPLPRVSGMEFFVGPAVGYHHDACFPPPKPPSPVVLSLARSLTHFCLTLKPPPGAQVRLSLTSSLQIFTSRLLALRPLPCGPVVPSLVPRVVQNWALTPALPLSIPVGSGLSGLIFHCDSKNSCLHVCPLVPEDDGQGSLEGLL